ncbi:hypothetical protein [Streptomyces olivochromogenes]|uniref:hypothetical protein n=1 Tax=Streptomyces olivochromogenes TaxID=1963 RepID=UPI0036BDD70A
MAAPPHPGFGAGVLGVLIDAVHGSTLPTDPCPRRWKFTADKIQVSADLGLEWAVAWHRVTVDLTMADFGPPPFTATR